MSEQQKKGRLGEVIRFVVTGGVCFLIEQAVLSLLKEIFGLDVNIGTPIAFLVSVVANYLLCVKWVFPGADGSGGKTKAGFVLTSGIGFFLNWGIMALLTALFGQDGILLTLFGIQLKVYHLNKAIATLLVMVWNYFTKPAFPNSVATSISSSSAIRTSAKRNCKSSILDFSTEYRGGRSFSKNFRSKFLSGSL